jgi:hypothetical protein
MVSFPHMSCHPPCFVFLVAHCPVFPVLHNEGGTNLVVGFPTVLSTPNTTKREKKKKTIAKKRASFTQTRGPPISFGSRSALNIVVPRTESDQIRFLDNISCRDTAYGGGGGRVGQDFANFRVCLYLSLSTNGNQKSSTGSRSQRLW